MAFNIRSICNAHSLVDLLIDGDKNADPYTMFINRHKILQWS